jgi:16S rRNA (guanine1516-N2)-methyltransferase
MDLIFGDSKNIIPNLSPQVILIDTMYQERKKTALVKSNMRMVREIVGSDPDYLELIDIALINASNRVVIKQPIHAEKINHAKPCSHKILGKTIRYDVYMKT